MSTVLAVYRLKGCVGTCDARCYMAKNMLRCKCICGGRNHGVGRESVSTEVIWEGMTAFRDTHPELDGDELTVVDRLDIPDAKHAREYARMVLTQLDLFDKERVA